MKSLNKFIPHHYFVDPKPNVGRLIFALCAFAILFVGVSLKISASRASRSIGGPDGRGTAAISHRDDAIGIEDA